MKNNFLDIYNEYKNDVLRLALSYTKRISDAEDITQNVFVKLYKNMEKLKDQKHIKKWCVMVTINECKNFCFSFWKRNVFSLNEIDYKIFSDDIKDNTIIEALFKLKPQERIIIYLYFFEGYKIKEIAEILKLKESNVKIKLSRNKQKLKKILEGEYSYEK